VERRLVSNVITTTGSQNYSARRHQLHLWIGHQEYAFLRALARNDDESMAKIVRRLIRQLRAAAEKNGHNMQIT
jgi:hypothetical protein